MVPSASSSSLNAILGFYKVGKNLIWKGVTLKLKDVILFTTREKKVMKVSND